MAQQKQNNWVGFLREEVLVKLHLSAECLGSDSPDGKGAEMNSQLCYILSDSFCGKVVLISKQIVFLSQGVWFFTQDLGSGSCPVPIFWPKRLQELF